MSCLAFSSLAVLGSWCGGKLGPEDGDGRTESVRTVTFIDLTQKLIFINHPLINKLIQKHQFSMVVAGVAPGNRDAD